MCGLNLYAADDRKQNNLFIKTVLTCLGKGWQKKEANGSEKKKRNIQKS